MTDKLNDLAGSYVSDDAVCNMHIELKREHTLMVCEEVRSLAEEIGLSQEKINLAVIIALFHDMGRFEQYYRYRTFDDSRSVNHASLSVEIIKSDGFLKYIPDAFNDTIFQAILNHNIPYIDVYENEEEALFSRLLRDSDKLDILRVVTSENLRQILEWKDKTDNYEVTDAILQRFRNHQIVTLDLVRSVNDLRLVRVGWIFDINFSATYKKIKERKLLEKLFDLMPDSEKIVEVKRIIHEYMEQNMAQGSQTDTV